ncbi:hypothetical protein ACK3SF_03395 [Candidatus Nanosalina sp. VS9-1]|uniref:hypothetical protein n=1 Tax=Candidatus Nanosalina sp. VS9-1 TaxID=3388566 RepID=UPI0039E08361
MKQKLQKLNPELEKEKYIYILVIFLAAALTGFIAGENFQNGTETISIDAEINSSNSVETVEFFNHSVDFMVEDGTNSTFYMDKNRDGSADQTFDTESDGEIHQNNVLVDYPENVYRITYRYQDSPEIEDDGWMEIYRVEALK